MASYDSVLARLARVGQEHLLRFYETLSPAHKRAVAWTDQRTRSGIAARPSSSALSKPLPRRRLRPTSSRLTPIRTMRAIAGSPGTVPDTETGRGSAASGQSRGIYGGGRTESRLADGPEGCFRAGEVAVARCLSSLH